MESRGGIYHTVNIWSGKVLKTTSDPGDNYIERESITVIKIERKERKKESGNRHCRRRLGMIAAGQQQQPDWIFRSVACHALVSTMMNFQCDALSSPTLLLNWRDFWVLLLLLLFILMETCQCWPKCCPLQLSLIASIAAGPHVVATILSEGERKTLLISLNQSLAGSTGRHDFFVLAAAAHIGARESDTEIISRFSVFRLLFLLLCELCKEWGHPRAALNLYYIAAENELVMGAAIDQTEAVVAAIRLSRFLSRDQR